MRTRSWLRHTGIGVGIATMMVALLSLAATPTSAASDAASAAYRDAAAAQDNLAQFTLLFTVGPSWDTAKAPNAQAHFATHSANLRRLKEAGVVVTGGRFGEYGLIVVRAPSLDSAKRFVAPDSSVAVGTFKVQVDRWSTIYEGTVTR